MPIPNKIQRTSEILNAMDQNTNFPTPNPALQAVQQALDELSAAYQAALDGGKTAKANQRTKEAALDDLLRPLKNYVNEIANGDEGIVLSSGFQASKIPEPIGPLPQVVNVVGKGGDGDGSVTLSWKSVYGAKSYTIETSDNGTNFSYLTAVSRTRNVKIEGLVEGQFYWFRVAALGAAGLGPFSDGYKVLAS